MSGYMGKYVIINLSTGKSEVVSPGDEFYKKYLTGYGMGAAVITERQKAKINPLSPEAHIGFCSGILTGTGAYFSGRFMVVGKSPLTGGWGDSNSGGFFSVEIKRAGYDAVFVTGKAKKPVYIYINDGKVEIKDAKKVWGKDTVETEELIRAELKEKKAQIACIGKAGEKLSLISGVVTDGGRIAARSGLGAVMGSKNLKALVVKGSARATVADPEKMKELNKKFLKAFKFVNPMDTVTVAIINYVSQVIARTGISVPSQPSTVREIYKKYGTSGLTVYSALTGDSPIKNWSGVGYVDYPGAYKLSDESVIAYQKKKYGCQACPLACGGVIDIKKGRYGGTEGHKPEYETLCSFGGLLLQDDLDTLIEINELCNREGIDTISAGGAVAFAIECFEKGIIDDKQTGGLKLGWGKSTEILKLTEMIIKREKIGNILADGVKVAAKKIGKGSEKFAVHAGGQELPMHDSRLDPGFGIIYQMEPTPGRHTVSSYLYGPLYKTKNRFPSVKKMIGNAKNKEMKNLALCLGTAYFTNLFNGAGLCQFGILTGPLPVVDYLNAVTGWNLSADEYLKAGERVFNLRKAFNLREGVTLEDSRLHPRAAGAEPVKKGPIKGVTLDMESLTRGFCELAGWDYSSGGPTKEKLRELGIADLAK
ncbi:MAG: aldehyde ferredoxin oxidoreductase family protein [Spirochaetes bacterium]|nr:aldehyde ferredoxin oxidoreductase family protein [Spirochaetota bacterium]